jgi:hypothetical protein
VLVGEGQPDDFKPLVFDGSTQPRCRFALLIGPKPVTLDKTQCVTPSKSDSKCSQWSRFVLVVIARSKATKQSILSLAA